MRMAKTLIFDTEANGLLAEATHLHCLVTKEWPDGETCKYFDDPTVEGRTGSIREGIEQLFAADYIVGHNILGYDLPLIFNLYGLKYSGRPFDTLILSRASNADRRLPPGCPTASCGTKGGKTARVGPHSLQAWGYRVGRGKPEHYDWDRFTAEMLHRCSEDVEINSLVLDALLSETDNNVRTLDKVRPWVWIEMEVAKILFTQQWHGWTVDAGRIADNIRILRTLMGKLEQLLIPGLPWICKAAEAKDSKATDPRFPYKHVSKPFTKAGKWTKQVKGTWPEFEQGNDGIHSSFSRYGIVWPVKFTIGGPFSRVTFRQISLSSDAEIKTYLLKLGWQPTEWNVSKAGKNKGKVTSPKITEDSLDSIEGKIGMRIAHYLKASNRLHTLEGWQKAVTPESKIHAYVNGQGCPTVRMQHKVIVNVPSVEKKSFFAKKMRQVFICRPGYTLVGTDSVSCQARMLAHYMGDDEYTHVVLHGKKEDGTDIHSFNQRKAGLPTRGHAKNFFYGFLFGAGPTKVGRLISKGPEAGKAIINKYLNELPKLRQLREGLKLAWKQRGYILGLDGRRIYPRKENDLLCYLLQGAEAILMKWAMVYLYHWVRAEGLDAHQVSIMHDEYTYEVLKGQEQRVMELSCYAMQKAGEDLGLTVPAAGEAATGDSWYAIH